MELQFDRLVLVNFKSYISTTRFKLVRKPGLHFVGGDNQLDPQLGSNGSGKSTLWDALTWCLYGRTCAGLRNPDVRSWDAVGRTDVKVYLRVDGERHIVQRTISPNHLLLDKKVVGQETIERLLQMSFDTFTNTILLGQARPLFFDLTSRGKMELFGDVLDLQRWEERSKAAREQKERLEIKWQERSRQVDVLQAESAHTDKVLAGLQAKSDEWVKERERRVKVNTEEITELEAKLQKLSAAKDVADLALDGALTELRPLQKQLRDLDRKYQHTLARSFTLRDGLKKGAKCPTCGQVIKGAAKQRRHMAKELDKVSQDIEDQLEIIQILETSEKQFQQRQDEAQLELNRLAPQVGALEAQIKALRADSEKEVQESNPLTAQITTLKRERAALGHQLKDLQRKCQILQVKASRAESWIRGFKEVALYEVDDVLRELELTVNAMLPQSGLQNWSVQFAVERTTGSGTIQRGLDVMITCPDNADGKRRVRWESWSGGEGQRLRIVGSLALSEVLLQRAGVVPSLEILDEPTQHLSPEGVLDLCEYLSDRADRLQRQIYYTDQQSVESAQFDSVVTISKTDQGSCIS